MLKQIVLLSCLMTVIFSLNVISPGQADTKLLAHWTFDQIEDNVIKDVAGNNDGVIVGGWEESDLQPGLHGNALNFNYQHHIKLKSTEFISLTDDFTVEYVIKPAGVTGFRTILWKGNRGSTPEAINYYFDIRDGVPELKFKDKEGKWIVYKNSKIIMEPGHWYHVIFTKQKGNVDIYVNGKKFSTQRAEDGKGVDLLPNEYNAIIGLEITSANTERFFFRGLIDDIKIYRGRVVNISDDYQNQWQQLLNDNKKRMARFDEVQAEKNKELQREYLDLFEKQAIGKNAPFTVSVLSSAKRLVKEPEFFKGLGSASKVAKISAARNEYEGFNIIVLGNPTKDTQINEVKVSDLVSVQGNVRIPATNITSGYVKDVTSEDINIPVDFIGAIPDVIMSGVTSFTIDKNSFTPVFIKVYVGDAKAGTYEGTVELRGDGHSEKVKVNLEVYDFTLPKRGSLRTALSFAESYYEEWYGIKTISDKQRESIHNFLLSYRISPNDIYPRQSIDPDLKSLEKIKDRTNFAVLKGFGNSKPVSEEALARQVQAIGERIEKVRKAGVLDDMYYYSYDELISHSTPEKLAAAEQIHSALSKAYPNLRMMQTSTPDPRIIDLFNVWVPLFSYFDSEENIETLERLRKRGDEIWWYSADDPASPYPNFFLDYSVYDNRIISTLSYMYNIDGLLYWRVNREWLTNLDIREQWPDAEWKPYIYSVNTGIRKPKNGMGNFIYPGPDGKLLPSLRLENLRDGLEDYEYLKELEKSIEKLETADIKDKDALLKEAKQLLQVPASVATTVSKWSSNPEHLLEYRNRLGEMISKTHVKLKGEDN